MTSKEINTPVQVQSIYINRDFRNIHFGMVLLGHSSTYAYVRRATGRTASIADRAQMRHTHSRRTECARTHFCTVRNTTVRRIVARVG